MAQPAGINRIDKDQKLYELSLIWKEIIKTFMAIPCENCFN